MYNAVIRSMNMSGEHRQPTLAPTDALDMQHNEGLVVSMIRGHRLERGSVSVDPGSAFTAFWTVLDTATVIHFLEQYRWLPNFHPVQLDIEFLKGNVGDPGVDEWVFLAPQLGTAERVWTALGVDLSSHQRTRTATDRFNVYTGSDHVRVAEYIAAVVPDAPTANAVTRALRQPRRGVMLFYPVHEDLHSGFTMGFSLKYPNNAIPSIILFGVQDSSRPDAVVVPVSS
jgi:hypothetical protein